MMTYSYTLQQNNREKIPSRPANLCWPFLLIEKNHKRSIAYI
ncbi:hypothetical protein VCA_001193 [Vibrio albensis VL426]|nr:hypothetical protein VCA_001193 [Vibrio cholerae VL426]